jgi:hypothetical protein
MRINSSGNVGIGTDGYAQKRLHIEGTTGSQVLISSADDTEGTTAGIIFRTEGGESNGLARVKGGIFFERVAGTYGNGNLHLAVDDSENNDTVTVADSVLEITTNKETILKKRDGERSPLLWGENYEVAVQSAATTSVNCYTGIIPETGIYDIFVKGNPNAQGSGGYASTWAGYLSIACDFVSGLVQFRISQATIIQDGGGSSNTQLVVAATLYNSANNTNSTLQPISAQSTTEILINVSNYINTAGTKQDIRIVRRL